MQPVSVRRGDINLDTGKHGVSLFPIIKKEHVANDSFISYSVAFDHPIYAKSPSAAAPSLITETGLLPKDRLRGRNFD